jgi:hypothetical protein
VAIILGVESIVNCYRCSGYNVWSGGYCVLLQVEWGGYNVRSGEYCEVL